MRRARLLLAVLALLLAPAAGAQPASESLEKDARAASRAGKFREAAVKFDQAATAAADAKRRARLRMQGAYASLNAGNSAAAREALPLAFGEDPSLERAVGDLAKRIGGDAVAANDGVGRRFD